MKIGTLLEELTKVKMLLLYYERIVFFSNKYEIPNAQQTHSEENYLWSALKEKFAPF